MYAKCNKRAYICETDLNIGFKMKTTAIYCHL